MEVISVGRRHGGCFLGGALTADADNTIDRIELTEDKIAEKYELALRLSSPVFALALALALTIFVRSARSLNVCYCYLLFERHFN